MIMNSNLSSAFETSPFFRWIQGDIYYFDTVLPQPVIDRISAFIIGFSEAGRGWSNRFFCDQWVPDHQFAAKRRIRKWKDKHQAVLRQAGASDYTGLSFVRGIHFILAQR